MKTYNFPQFNIEIVDPIVTANKNNIIFDYVNGIATTDVVLETPNGSKFGIKLENMPINNVDLNLVDIDVMVTTKLTEYEV